MDLAQDAYIPLCIVHRVQCIRAAYVYFAAWIFWYGQRVLAYYATVRVILRGVTVRLWFNRKQKNRDSCPLRRRKILEKPCICTRNYFIFLNALWLTNRLIFFYVFAIIKNIQTHFWEILIFIRIKNTYLSNYFYNNILKQNL